MPRIFKHLEAGCLQLYLMSTSTQKNQLKYTILYYTILYYTILYSTILKVEIHVLDLLTGGHV